MTRRLVIAIISLSLLLALLIRASAGDMINPFLDVQNLGMWVGAILTLFALSFLYGDNPFYRFTENLFVGVTAAYWMVTGFWSTIVPKLMANIAPEIPAGLFDMQFSVDIAWTHRLLYCIPLTFGLLLLARLHPRGRGLSVWTLAFILGTTAGLRLVGHLNAGFLAQVSNCIVPVIEATEAGWDIGRLLDALLITFGVVCCLLYFHFGRCEDPVVGTARRIGLWILMVTFGAGFGFTVMGRIALLVGRMEFLLQDWLGII